MKSYTARIALRTAIVSVALIATHCIARILWVSFSSFKNEGSNCYGDEYAFNWAIDCGDQSVQLSRNVWNYSTDVAGWFAGHFLAAILLAVLILLVSWIIYKPKQIRN